MNRAAEQMERLILQHSERLAVVCEAPRIAVTLLDEGERQSYRNVVDNVRSDVYDVGVIRKQLYISEDQERALKVRAREAGVSEAELVRGFLDRLLFGSLDSLRVPPGRTQAALDFLEATDEIASSHRFAEGYRFDREELYEDRGASGHAGRTG